MEMEISQDLTDRSLALRRSQRIRSRDERRRREEMERKEIEERKTLMRVPKRLTKHPVRKSPANSSTTTVPPKKKKLYDCGLSQQNTSTAHLSNLPLDILLYMLEFLGPSLATMERASKSFHRIIRGQHSPYRFLYYKLLATYCPNDGVSIFENGEHEHAIHATVLPKIYKTLVKKESKECKVSNWKIQFVESHKYYVTQVCTICGEAGDPIPVWEVRLCRFCVVRQLINKSALPAFSLTSKEIEVLKPWKTYVYDLGMHCTFYLRAHLDHLRRQKFSDPQAVLDANVSKRQAERFGKENAKRKRKQREQEESFTERTSAILRCFEELRLKRDLSVMDEWWFPKELKLEIHEYISNKTNNSLARKRLRLSIEQDISNSNTPSPSPLAKSKSLHKNLDEIMTELRHVVVPRVERLMELNSRLFGDGIAIDKLRMDLDLKTRRIYDDFVLGGLPYEHQLTVSRTRSEILNYFKREEAFESSITNTFRTSVTPEDFLCVSIDPKRFLQDAREWWARRGKKPPPEKCGELYLARVRKRQLRFRNDVSSLKTQENWRRELLERKLREKVDWYFTDLPRYIAELKNLYERNFIRRMKSKEYCLMKGLSSQYDMEEPPERLKMMYGDYEDFIKNCNGFCSTDDGYCGCLEYAAKDIIRANTVLRRRDWMDAQLRKFQEIEYRGPDYLLCPEAKEEYHYAARNVSVPKRAAVMYICRAERFMRRLIREVPSFATELITAEARDWYKRFLGIVSDFYDPPRRPCSWTAFTTHCYYYEVHNNTMDRPEIDYTIQKIRECESNRISRLTQADCVAKQARLSPSFWNKSMVKRPMDGVSFATRVRWIASNGWFSLNQLAQAWIYDEEQAPLSQLEPYIKEKVKQMERERRKEEITSRIKDDPEYQKIFKEIDEDAEFFLRATYEINTIYKVSNLYKAHVEDVKPGIDPARVVRQVIDLIRDVKTGVISKSSLFVSDREKLAEEEDDNDDDNNGAIVNNGTVGNAGVHINNNVIPAITNATNINGTGVVQAVGSNAIPANIPPPNPSVNAIIQGIQIMQARGGAAASTNP
ncbi:15244_t:CDS:10 [Acaulospora morrowiae]|uniref:15244_t:CDS:1 n=1 Tax=Acaulospora morrowiae TaxID=94023 RepID=A0A9N8ZVY6_9GLOM|nr:15244_t:CDS:10 [Acaulospora morrowiae]